VKNVIVWGNHSDTQYPDITFATIRRGSSDVSALASIQNDEAWARGDFIQTVQKRGGAIIDAMKKSSAASAANAAVEHVRSWVLGTRPGQWVSMAVCSNGEYGVPKDLIFSFPCTCRDGAYTIVGGLEGQISDFAKDKMKVSWQQLEKEDQEWRDEPAPSQASSSSPAQDAEHKQKQKKQHGHDSK
jgi:malate/lactate dehydrogenase